MSAIFESRALEYGAASIQLSSNSLGAGGSSQFRWDAGSSRSLQAADSQPLEAMASRPSGQDDGDDEKVSHAASQRANDSEEEQQQSGKKLYEDYAEDIERQADSEVLREQRKRFRRALERQIDRKWSRAVATRALFVRHGFYRHATAPTIPDIGLRDFSEWDNGILYVLAYDIMLPLQGFFNCLVFVRDSEMKSPEGRFFQSLVCWGH